MSKLWSVGTMEIINKLTPDIKGKAFEPDWFLLRQRLEGVDARLRELDGLQHIHRAAFDFVANVDNHLVEGSGEMPVKADASFRELRNALNKERGCESCGMRVDLSNSKMIYGVILCDYCARMGKAHSLP